MKRPSHQLSCAAIGLIFAATAKAQDPSETTIFSEPAEYCFPDTVVHREFTDRGFAMNLAYHVLIPNEDLAGPGDIYVGARFKNRPDELWLLSGTIWRTAENSKVGWPTVYTRFDEQLPPIFRVSVYYDPAAIASLGDGEIWIGYGLRNDPVPTPKAFQESFDEMMRNERYNLFWEILPGKTPLPGKVHPDSATLCLETTQMIRTVPRASSVFSE